GAGAAALARLVDGRDRPAPGPDARRRRRPDQARPAGAARANETTGERDMSPTPEPSSGRDERVNEVIADYLDAVAGGRPPSREEVLARHPDLAEELRAFFADQDRLAEAAGGFGQGVPAPAVVSSEAPTLAPGGTAPAGSSLGTVRYFGDYELLEEIA